jgi:hypothetical protein
LALVPESGQQVLSVGHQDHVVDTGIAGNAPENFKGRLVGSPNDSLVYQPDLFRFVKQSLRAGIGAAVERRGIPQLTFELPQVAARLLELRLL